MQAEAPKAYAPEFVVKSWIWSRPASRSRMEISAHAIYTWRWQQLIDSRQLPRLTGSDHAELVAAVVSRRQYEALALLAAERLPV